MSNSDDEEQIINSYEFNRKIEEVFGRPKGSGPNGELTAEEQAAYHASMEQSRRVLECPDWE